MFTTNRDDDNFPAVVKALHFEEIYLKFGDSVIPFEFSEIQNTPDSDYPDVFHFTAKGVWQVPAGVNSEEFVKWLFDENSDHTGTEIEGPITVITHFDSDQDDQIYSDSVEVLVQQGPNKSKIYGTVYSNGDPCW